MFARQSGQLRDRQRARWRPDGDWFGRVRFVAGDRRVVVVGLPDGPCIARVQRNRCCTSLRLYVLDDVAQPRQLSREVGVFRMAEPHEAGEWHDITRLEDLDLRPDVTQHQVGISPTTFDFVGVADPIRVRKLGEQYVDGSGDRPNS